MREGSAMMAVTDAFLVLLILLLASFALTRAATSPVAIVEDQAQEAAVREMHDLRAALLRSTLPETSYDHDGRVERRNVPVGALLAEAYYVWSRSAPDERPTLQPLQDDVLQTAANLSRSRWSFSIALREAEPGAATLWLGPQEDQLPPSRLASRALVPLANEPGRFVDLSLYGWAGGP